MITRTRKTNSRSYFKDNDYYNTDRDYEYTIKLFGITVYKIKENFTDDLVDVKEILKDKQIGFGKCK